MLEILDDQCLTAGGDPPGEPVPDRYADGAGSRLVETVGRRDAEQLLVLLEEEDGGLVDRQECTDAMQELAQERVQREMVSAASVSA